MRGKGSAKPDGVTLLSMTTDIVDAEQNNGMELPPQQLRAMIDSMPPLRIGVPFAVAGDGLELVEHGPENRPATVALVHCEGPDSRGCGKTLRMNLLSDSVKVCPGCGRRFTTMLVIAEEDDDHIIADTMVEVLVANGLLPPPPEQADDEEEEAQ